MNRTLITSTLALALFAMSLSSAPAAPRPAPWWLTLQPVLCAACVGTPILEESHHKKPAQIP